MDDPGLSGYLHEHDASCTLRVPDKNDSCNTWSWTSHTEIILPSRLLTSALNLRDLRLCEIKPLGQREGTHRPYSGIPPCVKQVVEISGFRRARDRPDPPTWSAKQGSVHGASRRVTSNRAFLGPFLAQKPRKCRFPRYLTAQIASSRRPTNPNL